MKWAALLFGLNYEYEPTARLSGCIRDTELMKEFLLKQLGSDNCASIQLYNDRQHLAETSYNGIIDNIFNLSLKAINDKLDLVVIHYSGHGSRKRDVSGDEKDGFDEVICPSNFLSHGMILDDIIGYLLSGFPSSTRVVTVFDSCHSGTVTDMPFAWEAGKCVVQNNNRIPAKVLSISGCLDNQTSGDTVEGGILTVNILKLIRQKPVLLKNVFQLIEELNKKIMKVGAKQRAYLTSSYDLKVDSLVL